MCGPHPVWRTQFEQSYWPFVTPLFEDPANGRSSLVLPPLESQQQLRKGRGDSSQLFQIVRRKVGGIPSPTSVRETKENSLSYHGKYTLPEDLLRDETLTHEEKVMMLKQWREDEEALQRATEEGMEGGARPDLKRVQNALNTLLESPTQQLGRQSEK